jgi:hypothetical protein
LKSDPTELKRNFIEHVEERAGKLQVGDSFLICILAHGASNGSTLLGKNFFTRYELYQALRSLSPGATVSVLNTACYAGKWEGLAAELPRENDAILSMACGPREKHYNYRTFSGFYRCSLSLRA